LQHEGEESRHRPGQRLPMKPKVEVCRQGARGVREQSYQGSGQDRRGCAKSGEGRVVRGAAMVNVGGVKGGSQKKKPKLLEPGAIAVALSRKIPQRKKISKGPERGRWGNLKK